MTELLTPSMICRQFTYLLSQAFGPIEFSGAKEKLRPGLHQKHIDLLLDPDEMRSSLDDLSERVLSPAASLLADCLKRDGAAVTFRLELPERAARMDLRCSIQEVYGMSVRLLMDEPKYRDNLPPSMQGKWIVRFDVLYRDDREAQQAA